MAGRQRRIERAAWLITRDLVEVGAELRAARLAAGLTLRQVGAGVGLSASMVLKIERGVPPGARPGQLGAVAAAVGMRARVRVFPDGIPLRDAAQLALLGRFRARLGIHVRALRLEQPVTDDPVDQRAFDGMLELAGCRIAVELIARFHDCQAQLRQLHLKQRDGGVDRLIVVALATHHNRRLLAEIGEALRESFPLGTRQVMRALSEGRDPGGNGIVLL